MIEELKKTITAKLAEAQVPVIQIDGRIKRLFSIHQKLKRQKIDLDQVYDFVALRIVTAVGARTATRRSASSTRRGRRCPGRIKDFIAMPRPERLPVAAHVGRQRARRSRSRCRSAPRRCTASPRKGIAAHWKYKEGRVGADRDEQYFLWLRQLLEWQQEVRDPQEFLQNLKIELYPEEVYIFTPQGRGEGAAARRDAGRLRLRHPHRRRPPVRRRARQRQDGAAAHPPPQRRHRRDRHARRATSRAATG